MVFTKKNYLKTIIETFILQIIFCAVAFFFMPWFSWLHDKIYYYSIITSWLFIGALHSTFWQLGKKDHKNITILNNHISDDEPKIKQNMMTGALLALPFLVVNVISVLVAAFDFNTITHISNGKEIFEPTVIFMIHRFLVSPFVGFLPDKYGFSYVIRCIILFVISYIPCAIAYISGAHEFSILDKYFYKLVYKQNKSNKK